VKLSFNGHEYRWTDEQIKLSDHEVEVSNVIMRTFMTGGPEVQECKC